MFVGEDGTYVGGEPKQRPDRVAILTLLRLRRFADLDRWLGFYQQEFEEDPRKENWAVDSFDTFEVAEPSLGVTLDAWVSAAPESFSAVLARGTWRMACGLAARGTDVAAKTSEAQMKAMEDHFDIAEADLERAIAMHPKAIAAHLGLMTIATFAGGDAQRRARFAAALAQCTTCYQSRAARLIALTPRWGGSYSAMDAFVAESKSSVAGNPKLGRLGGFAPLDRCRTWAKQGEVPRALAACDEAIAFGQDPAFLETRGRILRDAGRIDEARADLDLALRISPHAIRARTSRYFLRRDNDDLLGAAEDLAVAHTLDPTDADLSKSRLWMIEKLRYEGDLLAKAGKNDDAVRYFELASLLAPDDQDLRKRQAWNAAEIGPEQLARRVAAAPENYDLRLLLDHALAKSRRFGEVVTSWDDYLARKPEDARAYRERGGAKWQAGQREAGVADTERACELGSVDACRDLPTMQARLAP